MLFWFFAHLPSSPPVPTNPGYFPFHFRTPSHLPSLAASPIPNPQQPTQKQIRARQTDTFGFTDSAPSHLPSPIRTHTTHTLHTTTNQKIKIKIRTSTSRLPLPSQKDPLPSPTISHHLFSHTISHQNAHNNRLHLHLPTPSSLPPHY